MASKSDVEGGRSVKHSSQHKKMSNAARHEHSFLGQLVIELLGPRFTKEVFTIFYHFEYSSFIFQQVTIHYQYESSKSCGWN